MAMAATAPLPRIPAAANTDTVTLSPTQSDASVYVSGLDDASVYVSGLDMSIIGDSQHSAVERSQMRLSLDVTACEPEPLVVSFHMWIF